MIILRRKHPFDIFLVYEYRVIQLSKLFSYLYHKTKIHKKEFMDHSRVNNDINIRDRLYIIKRKNPTSNNIRNYKR